MGSALWKDLFREIRLSISRFISIFVIIFIGVGFFAGVKATAPDMKHSMDLYYDEYSLMDIRVMSTLGLTDDDIDAIGQTDGVLAVQPGYFTDAVSTVGSTEFVFRIHSIPSKIIVDQEQDYINSVKLTQGRMPNKSGECVVEDTNIMDLGLSIGDRIELSSGKKEEIKDGVLKTDVFTIVGKVVTPYYLSYEKGASDIGSGRVDSFMMILDDDFGFPCYTEALVTVKNAESLNSYNKKYRKLVSKVVIALENLGFDRSGLRLEEIKDMAEEELDKARKEYDEQKKLFKEEIGAAEEELNQAQDELVKAEATLETEKKNFEEFYDKFSYQIEGSRKALEKAEDAYDEAEAGYENTVNDYGDEITALDSASDDMNKNREEAQTQVDQLFVLYEDPNTSEEEKQSIRQLIDLYENYIGITDESVGTIDELSGLGEIRVSDAESQLDTAKANLDSQKRELSSSVRELAVTKKEAEAEFAAAEKQIAEGWEEFNKGKAEYDEKKAEGEKELEEGREQIIRAENEIEKLSKPQWYVLDRDSHYSYVDYGKTADRIDAIAKIFPVFFFLIASLVCLTTMTRMVDEQRGLIGTYKALGYSNKAISLKYVLYAGIASILGGCSGLFLGMKIFPEVIYKSWSMMYTLPPLKPVQQIPLMVFSVLVGVLITTVSAFGSCYNELKETPALLMRPKSPKAGKKVFLERVGFIWNRLSFSAKVTVRNIFRYKKRFFMTIIGIVGCCALLLAGFGLNNSISQIVDKQYKEIFSYNINMRYSANVSNDDRENVLELLDENENVSTYFTCSKINATVKSNDEDISVSLIIPGDIEIFKDFISLRERRNQKPIEIPDKGLVVTEKLAKELKIGVGDSIELDNGDGARKKVEVTDIAENYIFHYAYMSRDYYQEIFRLAPERNNIMIKLKKAGVEEESLIGSELIKHQAVASIEYYSAAAATFEDTVKILNSIVIVIIFCAGLLAFVVLYNLTNINICERIREIATIKVLGFYNREVAAYVYRENIILSVMGAAIGLTIGIILHRFMMISIEQDGVMFGNHIDGISFLYAVLITIGFVVLVNIAMYRRINNISMVESLKSVE